MVTRSVPLKPKDKLLEAKPLDEVYLSSTALRGATRAAMREANYQVFQGFAQVAAGKDDCPMDWQEKYIDKLDRDLSEIKQSLAATEERIARSIDHALVEIRNLDNQRHAEYLDIRNFLAEERRWVIGIAIATILGIAAMAVTVLWKG